MEQFEGRLKATCDQNAGDDAFDKLMVMKKQKIVAHNIFTLPWHISDVFQRIERLHKSVQDLRDAQQRVSEEPGRLHGQLEGHSEELPGRGGEILSRFYAGAGAVAVRVHL